MATEATRLSVRLAGESKRLIEEAAAAVGQSMSAFAADRLVDAARAVLRDRDETRLSGRDRDTFLAAVNDPEARPNAALSEAADEYKTYFGHPAR